MKILGISGLHFSQAYKRHKLPNLDERYYRIAQGFDAAAALIIDGEIVAAAAEERFMREKSTGRFPYRAAQFCLQRADIEFNQLDYIAHGFNFEPHQNSFMQNNKQALYETVFSRKAQTDLLTKYFGWSKDSATQFIQVPHHFAHAASCYYTSGFDQALIMIADGMGETQSVSMLLGDGDKLSLLAEIPEIHSLGILYGMFTLYLGFDFNADEYKVMGLAPYGNPDIHFKTLMSLVELKDSGRFAIPFLSCNKTFNQQETYEKTLEKLVELFGSMRQPGGELSQNHKDIAAALQAVLQKTLLHTLRYFQFTTQQQNLAMAGGVALNCSANAQIRQSRLFKNIYIQPAAGDDGSALGAALHIQKKHASRTMPYLGPDFSNEEIENCLLNYPQCQSMILKKDALLIDTAKHISNGKVVGWFQGRMEFGPRALGNRSIIADPRNSMMQKTLNLKIKQREDFRPFAPAVLIEDACEYFEISTDQLNEYKYMQIVAPVKPAYRALLPAVTHVDYSARLQVVDKTDNPLFWELINTFKKLTGVPILINTSFNVNTQPIVCHPEEAIETFELAQLDYLVIGHHMVSRI